MANSFDFPVRPLRRVEYDKLVAMGVFEGERIELLEGRLVHMSPIGAPHSSTIDRLNRLFAPLFDRVLVRIQNPFAATAESEPQPDVALMPLGDYDVDHPDRAELLIEVADSSLAYDRGPKLSVYAKSGVPEYWIVNLVERCIEVYRRPANGRYWLVERHGERAVISPERFPDFELRVADVLPAAK
jgi:Uma2 family endonuclease